MLELERKQSYKSEVREQENVWNCCDTTAKQLDCCIPCGAGESRSLSVVTATAESTLGSTDTIISSPEDGGECMHVSLLEGENVTKKLRMFVCV